MEWAVTDGKMIEEALDQHAKKFYKHVDDNHTEFIARLTKNKKNSMLLFKIYILFAAFFLGLSLGPLF